MHLLVIAEDSIVSPPIAALSASAEFKIHRKPDLDAARPLLATGMFEACLLVVDRPGQSTRETIAQFRALAPDCPLVIAPRQGSPDDERAAYEAGADIVLVPPANQAAFFAVLRRLATRARRISPEATPPPPARPAPPAAATPPALEVLRDFSRVFSYSLDHREFTRQFALKLREIIGAARVAVFLEPPPAAGSIDAGSSASGRLSCVGAVGLPADLVECFELSREGGLGRRILRTGQILRLGAESAAPFLATDPRLQREFEILGCEIALPVNDRERTIGVALLGGRLTGAPFTDAELLLVCHLMEELGLAVKNSWLHLQLAGNHRLFSDLLGAMTAGALVVGPDFAVRYANQAFLRFLQKEGAAADRFDFADLPPPLAAGLREAIGRGKDGAPFLYEHPGSQRRTFRVSVIPFPASGPAPQASPALMLLEDFTQVRQAQRAEIEASNLKLIGLIARRFAHEIRNSLVPLATHQQLFDTDYANAEFRDSLKLALGRETSRIQRFTEQMLFLAQTEIGATEVEPFVKMLQNSFDRSRDFLGRAAAELELRCEAPIPMVRCHRPSLLHAFQEIFLNGLQSAGDPPKVNVSIASETMPDGRPGLAVRVHDNGRGFAPDVAARAADPFYTTRNTGVGLGLTVAKRVIEAHAGRIEVQPRGRPEDPDLVIHLPLNL